MIHTVVIRWTTLRIQTMLHSALVFHIVAGTGEINVDITLFILIKAFLLLIFNWHDCYWGTCLEHTRQGVMPWAATSVTSAASGSVIASFISRSAEVCWGRRT